MPPPRLCSTFPRARAHEASSFSTSPPALAVHPSRTAILIKRIVMGPF